MVEVCVWHSRLKMPPSGASANHPDLRRSPAHFLKQPWKPRLCARLCARPQPFVHVPPTPPPTLPHSLPPLGMMGGTLSTAALNWDKEFQGNLPFTASGSPPRGAAGTGSPRGTCLLPCLWKIYGCLRRLWYLNTTNDGGEFARSRLERRRWRRRQQCL